MSLKSYPLKFNLFTLNSEEVFSKNVNIWDSSRGFIPNNPLYYEDQEQSRFLVITLYNDYKHVTYQFRNINDDNVETKYKFSKPVYETHVKTDDRNLSGLKIICEGSIDCILLRQNGINAWTTLGLKAYKIKRLLEEIENSKFIYIMDNDLIGSNFSKYHFKFKGLEYRIPPGYKDVNELFIKDKVLFTRWITNLRKLANS